MSGSGGLGYFIYIAAFTGPTQLSVVCSSERQGEPGIFIHVSMTQLEICRTNRVCFMYYSTDYTLNTWCVQHSPPTSQISVVSYLVPWLCLLFWAQRTHAQLNTFYHHPFYPDVTHVRKDTRPPPAFPYCKRWKDGRGLGLGVIFFLHDVNIYT